MDYKTKGNELISVTPDDTLSISLSPDEQKYFFNQARQYRELIMMYNSAIKEVKTKLEVLNDELSIKNERNPIESISSRVKSITSIVDKLNRKGKEISVKEVYNTLNDVAGIRIICSFVDDIYQIANMLIRQDDIKLVEVKDYIQHPKPNGYRSLHLVIEVPIFLSNRKRYMKVEIQIRTMAMDFWASLEHELKYKHDIENENEISKELRECAEVISNTDMKMLEIRDKIKPKHTEDARYLDLIPKL